MYLLVAVYYGHRGAVRSFSWRASTKEQDAHQLVSWGTDGHLLVSRVDSTHLKGDVDDNDKNRRNSKIKNQSNNSNNNNSNNNNIDMDMDTVEDNSARRRQKTSNTERQDGRSPNNTNTSNSNRTNNRNDAHDPFGVLNGFDDADNDNDNDNGLFSHSGMFLNEEVEDEYELSLLKDDLFEDDQDSMFGGGFGGGFSSGNFGQDDMNSLNNNTDNKLHVLAGTDPFDRNNRLNGLIDVDVSSSDPIHRRRPGREERNQDQKKMLKASSSNSLALNPKGMSFTKNGNKNGILKKKDHQKSTFKKVEVENLVNCVNTLVLV